MTAILYGGRSDIGKIRSENQDSMGMSPATAPDAGNPKGVLFVVADGMGGHRAGRRASELTVSTILDAHESSSGQPISEILMSSIAEANTRVFEEGSAVPAYSGMGTTCTVVVLQGSQAWIGHVGDSKVFLVSSEGIRQVTTDHSRVWDLVTRGIITQEQARVHPERNLLTRALGSQPDITPDLVGPLSLTADSRLVMCTDGLTNHLENEDIRRLAATGPPQDAADAMVRLAIERGGTDNITVQVIGLAA